MQAMDAQIAAGRFAFLDPKAACRPGRNRHLKVLLAGHGQTGIALVRRGLEGDGAEPHDLARPAQVAIFAKPVDRRPSDQEVASLQAAQFQGDLVRHWSLADHMAE